MGKAKKGVYICPNCLNYFEVGEITKWKFIYAKYKENEKVFCSEKCQEEYLKITRLTRSLHLD